MKKSCVVAALMLVASTGVAAQDAAAANAPAMQGEVAEKKICRTERMTGSRTRSTRTCLTRSEWSHLAEVTRKGIDNIIDDANKGQSLAATGGTPSAQ